MKSLETIKADNARAARATHRRGCPRRTHQDGRCACAQLVARLPADKVRARFDRAAAAASAAAEAYGALVGAHAELLAHDGRTPGVTGDEQRAAAYLLLARAATELAGRAIEASTAYRARGGR